MEHYLKIQEYLKSNQSTWLITGVAGFIGSNLLEKLLTLNQRVVGLDNFDTGYHDNIKRAINDANDSMGKDFSENFKFMNGDIRNIEHCREACSGIDYVLHQAALGSVPRSLKDPISTNRANVDGFLNMLLSSRDANVKRFVYAASSSTYGDHAELPKIEDVIGNPLSPYAVSKLVNELYASVFARCFGYKTIGLRYFNIFGKRQDPNGAYAAVIPRWIRAMLDGSEVFIYGDGETSRDFCYIDNAVQINILAAVTDNEEALNQVYNVALNDRTSLNELYRMIEHKLHGKGVEILKDNQVYREFRSGDVRHSQADISKAKRLLNYFPKYKISDGLDHSIDWYIDNT